MRKNEWLQIIRSHDNACMVAGWITENGYPLVNGMRPQVSGDCGDLFGWVWENRKGINDFIRTFYSNKKKLAVKEAA